MPVRTPLSLYRGLGPWAQDALIASGMFTFGCVLYLTGLYQLFSDVVGLPWWRFLIFCGICAAQLLRRRAPGLGLAIGVALVAVDCVLGLSAPMLAAFSDLLFAATLHGSRRLSRAMVPAAAITTIGGLVVALVLLPSWREAVAAGAGGLPLVVVPVWWATNVRQQRDIAESERANAVQLARIADLDRDAAVTSERSRMARDLHDVIAGHLSAIAIQSEAALNLAGRDDQEERVRTVLRSVRANSVEALDEMRAMIGLLRADDTTDAATAPARLVELVKLVESARASGMEVEVRVDLDDSVTLPAAVDLTAYRIAQEALTNAVKHAPGARASLTVRQSEGKVDVEVTNELRGAARDPDVSTGTGLLNMRERAQAVGGSLRAGPGGHGWLVAAELPLPGRLGDVEVVR